VIIRNLDLSRPIARPHKADEPLEVDAYAALSGSVANEFFQPVPWRGPQECQRFGRIQLLQFTFGHVMNIGETPNALTFE